MRLITFFISVMLLGDLVLWWQCRRSLRTQNRGWRWLFSGFFALQTGTLALVLAIRMGSQVPIPRILFVIAYLWHCLLLLPTLVAWLLITSGRRILYGIGKLRAARGHRPTPSDSSAHTIGRREFLARAAWATPALLTVGTASAASIQLQQFRVRRMALDVPNLPAQLNGLTIAQVTDLHVGRFTSGKTLERIADTTNSLTPDLVAVTGDFINFSLEDLPASLDVLRALKPREGLFACEGNHDLFENAREFRRRTEAAGVPLLRNDATTITVRGHKLQILGLRWGRNSEAPPHGPGQYGDQAIASSMQELLRQRDPSAFPILLAHHPHAFDFAEDIPLTLAGHTHGGQLMLSPTVGFGPMLFRYWSGLYQKHERALVVSNGVGNWFPLRIGAPAEIVHITLRRAS